MKKLFFVISFLMMMWCYECFAMVVFDPTVAAKLVEEMQELQRHYQLLQQQLKGLEANQYQWSNAQGLLNQLGTMMGQSQGLSYNAQNLDQQFRQLYPGYHTPKNYSQEYQNITNTSLNTLNGTLQTVGTNAKDFENENTRLAFLQKQSQSAVGQTQAIQAGSQIASEQISQLQLLRQTLMAQTNAQTTYYAAQLQKEANEQAALSRVIQAGSTNVPAYGGSGHTMEVPNF